jgi:hypothetical protein
MKLYTSGIKPHKLGSPQDRVIRKYLVSESEKEAAKTHLLALLVANSIPFTDAGASRDWETKIKKIWTTYLGLEYGVHVPEHDEKELDMMAYYNKYVKNLKPVLDATKNGLRVSGLSGLME